METMKPSALGDGAYTGEIRAFAGPLCPNGWRVCDGRAYPTKVGGADDPLFLVIGDYWGRPDALTYRVPDLRGVFLRGWSADKKESERFRDKDVLSREILEGAPKPPIGSPNQVGTYQIDSAGPHTHPYEYTTAQRRDGGGGGSGANDWYNPERDNDRHVPTSTSPNAEHETRPVNAYVMFCIRDGSPI